MSGWRDCRVSPEASVQEAMKRIEECERRIAVVATEEGQLQGVLTDGDIRRGILQGVSLEAPVTQVMNDTPIVARPEDDPREVAQLMSEHQIHQIPVVDAHGQIVQMETIDDFVSSKERSTPVLVLAGGLGTRLRPITEDRPKPLVEVEGIPILETLINKLASQGFSTVYLSVNYKASMIEDHFGSGSEWNVQIKYLREDKRLGTAGPLSLLPRRVDEPILVLNGDLLTTLNFGRLVDYHDNQSMSATMGVRRHRMEIPYGVVEIERQKIVNIEEKPSEEYFVNAGIYVLGPETLKHVPDNTYYDMPELFQVLVDAGKDVTAYPISEYWRDIGKQEDLEQAEEEFTQVFN